MAKNSTLTIKYGGNPLVGAEVFSTAKNVVSVTDGSGQITDSFADTYAAVVIVAVRHASFPYKYVATLLLEAGENYELNIPNIVTAPDIGYDSYLGLHSDFLNKL